MQGTTRAFFCALFVKGLGDLECIRIELQDGIDGGTVFVEVLDALKVHLCELFRGKLSRGHRSLQLGDGGLLQVGEWASLFPGQHSRAECHLCQSGTGCR